MTNFSRRVAELAGVPEARLQRLSGGDLSEVLLVHRGDGRKSVAKGGPSVGTEAAMLRALAKAGAPAPAVESEHHGVLFLQYVPNDRIFNAGAWRALGEALRRLHGRTGESYGWPVDYQLGTVELANAQQTDWPAFWAEQRLTATAAVLDRPWRLRIDRLAESLRDLLPQRPPAALLHGDLWTGNILVADGRLAALIDPACYHGDPEVDLAMLSLFDAPPEEFWESYGVLDAGWRERRPAYQLFPALVHLRLFGGGYAGMVDRLLRRLGH
jgi:fructosamine-3-kinase